MITIIENGSEKQNTWAKQIAENWIKNIDSEIEANLFREEGSKYYHLIGILKTNKGKAIEQLSKMTSKQIIDFYTRQNMMDKYVIKMSREQAEREAE